MKQTKKGFTLVELLVVIAILAILATVSVVGYTSFIQKANISNDTVIARELTTLIQATDITDPVEDFDDVINVLYENGFLLANLNTKTEGCFFVWESKNNQILLVDGQNNFEVLFPTTYEPAGQSWYLVCADKDSLEGLTVPTGVQIKRVAATVDSLIEWLAQADTDKIYVDNSIVINEDTTITVNDGKNITLVLGDSALSTNGTIQGVPLFVEGATLNLQGGTLNSTGQFTNDNGTYCAAIGYNSGTNINVDGTTFVGVTGINGTVHGNGQAVKLNVENCTFNVSSLGIALCAGTGADASATITNCTIDAGKWAIFTSQGGQITVNGGSYTSTGEGVLGAQDANTKIIVEAGNFEGKISVSGGAKITINGGTFDCSFNISDSSEIIINGGTFNGVDYLVYFNKFLEAGQSLPGVNVQVSDGVVTLTKA